MKKLLALALGALTLAASGAAKPVTAGSPTVSIADATCSESVGTCVVTITKGRAKSYSKITVQTIDGSARAGSDYTSVSRSLTLGNTTTSTTVAIPIINDNAFEPLETFTVKITASRNAIIGRSPATVTITDDDASTAPPPPPPPPPTTNPDGLSGETAVQDNFTTANGITITNYGPNGSGGIAPQSVDDVGAFRMFCTAGQLVNEDPLVYPGGNSPHLHQFVGNTLTNKNSNYSSLRTTGGTTCGNDGSQTTPINRSAYWVPAVLDGAGSVVEPDVMFLYYKRIPDNVPGCTDSVKRIGICVDLPNGIKFVQGYDMKLMTHLLNNPDNAEYWQIAFFCWGSDDGTVGDGGATGRYHSIKQVVDAGCPAGAQLIITGFSPNCWDGKNLDSADHRSHINYPNQLDLGYGARCDSAHPYLIPDMQFQWHYTTDANFRAGKWRLSSDDQMSAAMGGAYVEPGSTWHMDYWEAWSPTAKSTWMLNCINRHESCASGDLGNGTMIKGADVPFNAQDGKFEWPKHQLVPVP